MAVMYWFRDPLTISQPVQDHFDRLPDPVLLLILNWVHDVNSLEYCYMVSRRFQSLIPLVDQVYVKIDESGSSATTTEIPPRGRGIFSHLSWAFQAISEHFAPFKYIIASISNSGLFNSEIPFRTPYGILRRFKELKNLKIELPDVESWLENDRLVLKDGALLKWKAGFSSTLENCAIFCASRVYENSPNPNPNPEETMSTEDLNMRFEWMESSLIAASAWHYFLQNIISDHETLERLIFTDKNEQGVIIMDKKQLMGFRAGPVMASSGRTILPALSIKLWYSNYVDLPNGMKFEGATLMAIQPSDVADLGANWVLDAFNEPYKTAAQMLLKRTSCSHYVMDSF